MTPTNDVRQRAGVVQRLRAGVGLWSAGLDQVPMPEAVGHVREAEDLGFAAFWFPGDARREPLSAAGAYLAGTRDLVVGSAVASIYGRDARATSGARRVLHELHGARHVMGLGVSHPSFVEDRGGVFGPPLETMRNYLTDMAAQPDEHAAPGDSMVLVGALGPKMLQLSGDLADGAFTYNSTIEHTEWARERLGSDALLLATQVVVQASSPDIARDVARRYLDFYLRLPNYRAHFERLGFSTDSADEGARDAIVDAVAVWGDPDDIGGRINDHVDAGADHVAVNLLRADRDIPILETWSWLAGVLGVSKVPAHVR